VAMSRKVLVWGLVLLPSLSGSGAAPSAPPPSRKWTGPTFSLPGGGSSRTIFYYGPWQCRQEWVDECRSKCGEQGSQFKGCIWLADIKSDVQTRFLGAPVSAGGRLAIKHCCCDRPVATDQDKRRSKWENAADSFRRKWSREFGDWPREPDGSNWPGHHIWDIKHGGAPVAEGNVLPVPPDVHKIINTAYLACYAGKGHWGQPGPYWPYAD